MCHVPLRNLVYSMLFCAVCLCPVTLDLGIILVCSVAKCAAARFPPESLRCRVDDIDHPIIVIIINVIVIITIIEFLRCHDDQGPGHDHDALPQVNARWDDGFVETVLRDLQFSHIEQLQRRETAVSLNMRNQSPIPLLALSGALVFTLVYYRFSRFGATLPMIIGFGLVEFFLKNYCVAMAGSQICHLWLR